MRFDKFLFKDKSKYTSVVVTTFLVGVVFGALLFWGINGYLFLFRNEGLPSSLPVWYLIFILPIQTGLLFQIFPSTYMLIRHWYSFLKFHSLFIKVAFSIIMLIIYAYIIVLSIIILVYLLVNSFMLFGKKLLKKSLE